MPVTTTEPYHIVAWHLHWRFWQPVQCSNRLVRFGVYADIRQPGGSHLVRDDLATVSEKRRLGVIQ